VKLHPRARSSVNISSGSTQASGGRTPVALSDPRASNRTTALFGIAYNAYDYYSTAGNNYSKPLAGIQTPIVVGGLILGVILMLASWPFFTGFFHRRWAEAADPEVLAADAAR
jgi:hypothetical protein